MSDLHKSYYAIIPANVRYDRSLKDKAKLLYGEITALSNEKGYCWASNSYFAELYDVSKETVSRLVSNLSNSGYITVEIIYDGKQVKERRIYIAKNQEVLTKTSIGVDENIKRGIDENVKDNNTSFNNTINNKDIVASVINYLNEKCHKDFKSTTKATVTVVEARIKDGFILEDFKKVVDIKSTEWLNDEKMNTYLRPKTLFGGNFESYLNQKPKKEKETIKPKKNYEDENPWLNGH